ncbi:zinc-binding dehydrogenase [Streptomyces sp. NPDC058690]|uniref:zinc-binding dehydrogenase n=1 Tax=Streptomyces sp. NPDC058690 TaxID=3346600 RepID=UPI0036680E8C
MRNRSTEASREELERLMGRRTVDAILDCVGSEASISMGFDLLGPEGALAAVGLMSQRVEHRQFPFVGTELSISVPSGATTWTWLRCSRSPKPAR